MEEFPSPVRRVVVEWRDAGRPTQPGIAWPRTEWMTDFPAQAPALSRLPDHLDRSTVLAASVDAAKSTEHALESFFAVMAWAYGDVGYGRYRTARILEALPDAALRLQTVANAVISDGARGGYKALATTSRLKWLGPAFGTKLLYFWQPTDVRPRALILDAYVAGWLQRETGQRFDPVEWSVVGYDRYLRQMHAWADALGTAPDELEMCMFVEEASRRGSQWGRGRPPLRPRTRPMNHDGDEVPFDAYPDGGRVLLGKPWWGDGTARRSYGVEVLRWCGYRCAYCGLDMSTFDGWLQLSIDHVIPQQMQALGYPPEWVLDSVNLVAACMACNGYFNRDPVIGEVPTALEAFCDLRDRVFQERRKRIMERQSVERAWFDENIKPSSEQ